MKVALVVAAADNGVIGRAGGLPWHLPADLAHFRRVTLGHHLVIGRRTWESVAKPLPGRRILVVTRAELTLPEGVLRVPSLVEALDVARGAGDDEVMIAGGSGIYQAALPLADRIYLTRVGAVVDGDTFFPALADAEWQEVSREEVPADERNAYPLAFVVLERRS
jgi:dihydrofolate reductase